MYDALDPLKAAQDLVDKQQFTRDGAELNIKELERLKAMSTSDAVIRLRAEQYALKGEIRDIANRGMPQEIFPRDPRIRGALNYPVTRLQHIIRLMNDAMDSRTGFDLNKFVDALHRFPQIANPADFVKRLDWEDHAVDTLTKVFRTANIPDTIANSLISEYLKIKPTEYNAAFEWRVKVSNAIRDALPANTPKAIVDQLTTFSQRTIEENNASNLTTWGEDEWGNPVMQSRPVLAQADIAGGPPRALPTDPTEMLRNIYLPDIGLLREANSTIANYFSDMRTTGLRGVIKADVLYYGPKWILKATSNALKIPTMALRMPAILLRKEFEGGLTNAMLPDGIHLFDAARNGVVLFPNGIPIPFLELRAAIARLTPGVDGWTGGDGVFRIGPVGGIELVQADASIAKFHDQSVPGAVENVPVGKAHVVSGSRRYDASPDIGMAFSDALDFGDDTRIPVSTSQFRNGVIPTDSDFVAWKEKLDKLGGQPIVAEIIHNGYDVGAVLDALENPDNPLNAWWQAEKENVIPKSAPTITPEEFLQRKIDSVKESLGGGPGALDNINPALEQYVRDGTMSVGGSTLYDATKHQPIYDTWRENESEISTARDRIHEVQARASAAERPLTPDEQAMVSELQTKMNRLYADQAEILRLNDGSVPSKGVLRHTDSGSITQELKRAWNDGHIEFPGQIEKNAHLGSDWRGHSVAENLRAVRDNWNRIWGKAFKPLQAAERSLSRGGLYDQLAKRYYDGSIAAGYDEATARAASTIRAAADVRDFHYDLSGRSTFQASMQKAFWFAPAVEQILYRWLLKIPGEYGQGVGQALLLAKAANMAHLLKSLGIVRTMVGPDGKGTDVVMWPGAGRLLDVATGGWAKTDGLQFYSKLEGFNMVSQSPIPTLTPALSFPLNEAAKAWGGPFKALSQIMEPYGPVSELTPRPIMYAAELLTGHPMPDLSPDFISAQYARAHDAALQYAFNDLQKRGIKQPFPEAFDNEAAYQKASLQWQQQLLGEANLYVHGITLTNLISSAFAPSSVYLTTAEKEAYQKWLGTVLKAPPGATWSDEQVALRNQWINAHPLSEVYAWSYYERHSPTTAPAYQGSTNFSDELLTGSLTPMNTADYALKIQGLNAYTYYLQRQQQEQNAIAPKGDIVTLLTHGYERSQTLLHLEESWNKYQTLTVNDAGKSVKSVVDAHLRQLQNQGIVPKDTYETQQLSDTILGLKSMADFFTGTAGIENGDYKKILGALYSKYFDTAAFNNPTTATGRALKFNRDNILTPYFAQTTDLYHEAALLNAAGQDASSVYSQISAINAKWEADTAGRTYKGQVLPTPEAQFYGNKAPADQKATLSNWATKPITWMDDFQRTTLGYPTFDGEQGFLDYVKATQDATRNYMSGLTLQANGSYLQTGPVISSSSAQGEAILAAQDANLKAYAAGIGPEASRLYDLNQAAPYIRINALPTAPTNPTWNAISATATAYILQMKAIGDSPLGYGASAVALKESLYQMIEQGRANDPEFAQILDQMSASIPDPGQNNKLGVPLYEALFFGQFKTDSIPFAVRNSILPVTDTYMTTTSGLGAQTSG